DPRDALHRNEVASVVLSYLVDRTDVRMIEPRPEPGFREQTATCRGVSGHLRRQHLERDVTTEARIVSEVDLAHSANAQVVTDLVGTELRTGRKCHSVGAIPGAMRCAS